MYIQRIIRGKNLNDFVTPWIGYCVYLYTGHHSFLPWLQYPNQYLTLFKRLPTMNTLTVMLTQLPALPNRSQWSGRWYADVPLRCALSSTPLITATGTINVPTAPEYSSSNIPLRYLVSDLFTWSSFSNSFVNWSHTLGLTAPRLTGKLAEISRLLQHRHPIIGWDTCIAKFMPPQVYFNTQVLSNHWISIHANGNILARFVPSCAHWMMPIHGRPPKPIWNVTPKDYRQYRQQVSQPFQRISIPHRLLPGSRPPGLWKRFWSLSLRHKVRTCWWRLLREKLYLRATLHRWDSSRWDTAKCQFCNSNDEDSEHFFVSCPIKWPFWIAALEALPIEGIQGTQDAIWCALVCLTTITGDALEDKSLVHLGLILEAVWLTHWQCATSSLDWSTPIALAKSINSPSFPTSDASIDSVETG